MIDPKEMMRIAEVSENAILLRICCATMSGLPIEVLIECVDLFQQGESTSLERKALLIDQRDQLIQRIEKMQGTLKRLTGKPSDMNEAFFRLKMS